MTHDPYDTPELLRVVLTAIATGVMTDAAIVAARGLVEAGVDREWVHAIAGAQDMDAVEWAWELLLEETVMDKWISVGESLPKDRQKVLAYCPSPRIEIVIFNTPRKGMDAFWDTPNGVVLDDFFTHWMPLPEAPE